MEIYKTQSQIAAKQNWLLSLVVLILITFGVLALTQGIAIAIIPLLFDIPYEEILPLFSGDITHPNGRMAMMFLQGLGGGLAFLLAGWLFSHLVEKASLGWKQQLARVQFTSILITIPLLLGFVMFDTLIIEWNANIQFPEALRTFEEMIKSMEESAMKLTIYLTDFQSFGEFIAGLLVIGVFAGIGEEYFFRGVMQPKMRAYTGSHHAGIWITAFIFSAIHFQFYGFVPRMLLGALFGYLYWFSGSLVYPMLAHILNNSLTVLMVYLNKLGIVEFDIESPDQVNWLVVATGSLLFIICLRLFIQHNQKQQTHGQVAESI